jgi:hypothetical protein
MPQSDRMSPAGFQGAAIILISLAVFIAAVLMTLSASGGPDESHPPDADDNAMSHVHGLGVDPADGTLYVAAHFGVFRIAEGEPTRVADRYQDTMGFAVVGPQHFLASGHPDLREDLPSSLGLIESRDGAETWQPLSLLGEADLHAIEPTDTTLYAIDAAQGTLIATDDQVDWRVIDTRPLVDIAAEPDGASLLATTPDGELLRYQGKAAPEVLQAALGLSLIDYATDAFVGTTSGGDVYVSQTGNDWQRVGTLDGEASALETSGETWYVAVDDAVLASDDLGRTWTAVVSS